MADDPFGDVQKDIQGTRGVLDGDAFRGQERVDEKVSPSGEGYDFVVKCQHCGRPYTVTIPWSELTVASVGALPADERTGVPWVSQGGFMFPQVRCSCQTALLIPITPDKAQRFLQTGISMRLVDPQRVGALQQQVLAQQQAGRARR